MTTKQLLREIFSETAEMRQSILEAAALEDKKEVCSKLDEMMETAANRICTFVKDEYGITLIFEDVDIEKLYWSSDGKNINDRLDEIFKIYAVDKNLGSMWNKLEKIMNTELAAIENNSLIGISIEEGWMMVYNIEFDGCDICEEKNAVTIDPSFIDATPPFHPNCKCIMDPQPQRVKVNKINWNDLVWR